VFALAALGSAASFRFRVDPPQMFEFFLV